MLEMLINSTDQIQYDYLNEQNYDTQKELGQYFTDKDIATYMASMIEPLYDKTLSIKILDAGAGAGILTISAAVRCLNLGYKRVHAVVYEIDTNLLPILRSNLNFLSNLFIQQKSEFTYEIRNIDFILNRPNDTFHISVINPPYLKYNSKLSPYSQATKDLFKGNPNTYASFMAIVAASLVSKGQMVSITPRSFTNGLYFQDFRRYLQSSLSYEKIHLFKSRNSLFKKLAVLQENIICYFIKRDQSNDIEVRSSNVLADNEIQSDYYPCNMVLRSFKQGSIVCIPESNEDAEIVNIVDKWEKTFDAHGYYISTGPVVEHRTREFITPANNDDDTVPLLRMHNIKPFRVEWSGKHKKDVRFLVHEQSQKHLRKNSLYLILKRFSSKDEMRRLTAGVYDPKTLNVRVLGLENHLNYIGSLNSRFSIEEAYGLAALFNSSFLDRYFRCISGSTQVNATEIREMKLPSKNILCLLGRKLMSHKNYCFDFIDEIVHDCLALKINQCT